MVPRGGPRARLGRNAERLVERPFRTVITGTGVAYDTTWCIEHLRPPTAGWPIHVVLIGLETMSDGSLRLALSLRLRLILAFMALVALVLVIGVAAFSINHGIRSQVADLQAGVSVDLSNLDLASVGLEIKGYWDPAGIFVASDVEVHPGVRRPKLRGSIQALDMGGEQAEGALTLYGMPIRVTDETEFPAPEGEQAGLSTLAPGERVEVTCEVEPDGWRARQVRTRDVQASDKIKGTATAWELDGEVPETLDIHGLQVALATTADDEPQSALERIEIATQLMVALHECRALAHGLLGADLGDDARPASELSRDLAGDLDRDWDRAPAVAPTGSQPGDVSEALPSSEAADALRLAAEDVRHYTDQAARAHGNETGVPDASSRWLSRLAERLPLLDRHVEELLSRAGRNPGQARRFLDRDFDPFLTNELQPLIYAYMRHNEEQLSDELQAIVDRSDDTTRFALWTSAVAMVAAVLLAFLVWRSIHNPIKALHAAASRIGRGRLDTRVDLPTQDEFGVLAEAFNLMASELARTTVSIGNLEGVFDSMSATLLILDRDGRIERANQAAVNLLGYSASELLGRPFDSVCVPASLSGQGEDWLTVMRSGEDGIVAVTEGELLRSDGSRVAVSLSGAELRPPDGTLKGYVCIAQDLTDRKAIEASVRDNLAEKELLLREVHHRVKNNMQVISSLLEMQAGQIDDPETVRPFQESQSRVRSMALIHEQLYQSADIARIDVSSYLGVLTQRLAASFGQSRPVHLELHVDDLSLDIDQSLACGLIINELVVNAYKHAFPEDRPGRIQVALRDRGGECELSVVDDGQGVDAASASPSDGGLGSSLVRMLVKQLHGTQTIEDEGGSHVRITFPVSSTPEAAIMS